MRFYGWEICCPKCHGDMEDRRASDGEYFVCKDCRQEWPVIGGVPDLRVFDDPYINIEADRAKGKMLSERLHDLGFEELLDFYYSKTDVVPRKHAVSYTRGMLAASARAEAALDAWEAVNVKTETSGFLSAYKSDLLEIGCGSGPLLAVAAKRFNKVIGIDIAFRWLIVAKKRLMAASVEVPLICACAEALPFREDSFDRVVADSVLEHLRDKSMALSECRRVMRKGGRLYIATPNRYSIGPDPHTGIWCGSWLPERWTASIVHRQGGNPPKRQLLSARSIVRLVKEAGFSPPLILLPDVPAGQMCFLGTGMRVLVTYYHIVKRLFIGRWLLLLIGPIFHAVTKKTDPNTLQ